MNENTAPVKEEQQTAIDCIDQIINSSNILAEQSLGIKSRDDFLKYTDLVKTCLAKAPVCQKSVYIDQNNHYSKAIVFSIIVLSTISLIISLVGSAAIFKTEFLRKYLILITAGCDFIFILNLMLLGYLTLTIWTQKKLSRLPQLTLGRNILTVDQLGGLTNCSSKIIHFMFNIACWNKWIPQGSFNEDKHLLIFRNKLDFLKNTSIKDYQILQLKYYSNVDLDASYLERLKELRKQQFKNLVNSVQLLGTETVKLPKILDRAASEITQMSTEIQWNTTAEGFHMTLQFDLMTILIRLISVYQEISPSIISENELADIMDEIILVYSGFQHQNSLLFENYLKNNIHRELFPENQENQLIPNSA